MSGPFKMNGFPSHAGVSPAKQKEEKKGKTRKEEGGYKWVDKPTKEHTMDRYEGTTYMKGGKYKGGIKETTHQVTGEKTYTKYKPTRKYKKDPTSENVKSKEISAKRYSRIKKRRSKRYKEEE